MANCRNLLLSLSLSLCLSLWIRASISACAFNSMKFHLYSKGFCHNQFHLTPPDADGRFFSSEGLRRGSKRKEENMMQNPTQMMAPSPARLGLSNPHFPFILSPETASTSTTKQVMAVPTSFQTQPFW